MEKKELTFEIKGTNYKGGGFAQTVPTLKLMQEIILKQYKYRKECKAKDSDGNEVGKVWRDEGKWKWYYSTNMDAERTTEHPYDLAEKGRKYDALKKKQKATYKLLTTSTGQEFILAEKLKEEKQRNDELVEALKIAQPRIEQLINRVMTGELRNRLADENIKILQALKNNSND